MTEKKLAEILADEGWEAPCHEYEDQLLASDDTIMEPADVLAARNSTPIYR
jgi:hypothetical protein